LAALSILKQQSLLGGALIVAPLRPATQVWPAERDKWVEFQHLDMVVLHGKDKTKLVNEQHEVYVINYEGLPWLINSGHLNRLLRAKWVTHLVFDELSKMKNASKKAKRRALLEPYLPRFAARWGLTGSPSARSLMDLFGQVKALDMGGALGRYISHYRAMFFVPVNDWEWRLQPGAEKAIYQRIKNVALSMSAEDYLDMPTLNEVPLWVELPPKARKVYDMMEDELLTCIESDIIHAPTAASAYDKCRQIASGALYKNAVDPVTGEAATGKREWYLLHDGKLDALEELLEELQGQQVLIAYNYRHDYERICQRLGGKPPHIGSGVTVKQAKYYEAAWNAGELPYLLGHPQSMGHGLNLQGSNACHVAWFTLTPDFDMYDQFNRRLWRGGSKASVVTVHRLIARRTVEQWAVAPTLSRKDKGQADLFRELKRLNRERS
jgi:hypothetical protein